MKVMYNPNTDQVELALDIPEVAHVAAALQQYGSDNYAREPVAAQIAEDLSVRIEIALHKAGYDLWVVEHPANTALTPSGVAGNQQLLKSFPVGQESQWANDVTSTRLIWWIRNGFARRNSHEKSIWQGPSASLVHSRFRCVRICGVATSMITTDQETTMTCLICNNPQGTRCSRVDCPTHAVRSGTVRNPVYSHQLRAWLNGLSDATLNDTRLGGDRLNTEI